MVSADKASIIEAIHNLFGDTSVSQEETLDRLTDIREALQMDIDAVESDIRAKNRD